MGSLLYLHKRMVMLKELSEFLGYFAFRTQNTNMGMFGARSLKPTTLWSGEAWLPELYRKSSRSDMKALNSDGNTRNYTDTQGRRRFTAGPRLKGTETYPKGFGLALCELWKTHRLHRPLLPVPDFVDNETQSFSFTRDTWADADLVSVAAEVGLHCSRLMFP
eukprot:1785171-Alexandrium_andersonii.AAC.3